MEENLEADRWPRVSTKQAVPVEALLSQLERAAHYQADSFDEAGLDKLLTWMAARPDDSKEIGS